MKSLSTLWRIPFRLIPVICAGTICSIAAAFAQQSLNSPASFNFNSKGIVFYGPDSSMMVNMRFRMQNVALFSTVSDDDLSISSTEIGPRRLRLRFGGYLYDPRLTYNLQLSFARGDLDFSDTGFPNIVRDAMVFWNFTPDLQISFGQTKLPGNRQRVISSADLQYAERSIVNTRFTLDRDFGFQFAYTMRPADVVVNLRAAISNGDGRNAPRITGAGFAYTGRVEVLPFGGFTEGGDYIEGDVFHEKSPKLSIGVSYSHNNNATRTGGTLGPELYAKRTMNTLYADGVLKYSGLAIYGEYAQRDSPHSPITTDSKGATRFVYVGSGALAQISYCFPFMLEIGGRWASVTPDTAIQSQAGGEKNENLSGLVVYYFKRHRAKASIEITQNSLENLAVGTKTKNWLFRLCTELGI